MSTDAKDTRKQELGSAWIFKRALNDNIKYNRWEDILDDPKYPELGGPKGIYPEVDKKWLETFFLQQKKMLEEFSNVKFKEFNREGGFMDFISKLVKQKYGISKKDAWNPADVWCIQDENKVIAEMKKITSEGLFEELQELNTYLRTLFDERRVVGISLKKISGKIAHYEEVNVGKGLEYLTKDYTFDVSKIKIDLSLKSGNEIKFNTQDTTMFVDSMVDKKKVTYKYQITTISSSRFNNLKWEPTASSAAAARLGKAPVAMVLDTLKRFNVNFSNSNKEYPKSAEEFNKNQKEYVTMFNAIKKDVETKIKDEKEFISNFTKIYMVSPPIANTKLMQLVFVYKITRIPKKDMDRMMTRITLLAQKKGDEFGPFGKLY